MMKQNSCEACFSVNFKKTYAISMGVNKRLLKRLNLKWVWLFLNKANCFGKKVFLQESVTYSSHGYLSTSFKEVNIDLWFSVGEKKKKRFEVQRKKKKTFEVRSEVRRNKKFLFFTEYSFSHCFPQSMLKWNRYAAKVFMVASSSLDVFFKKLKVRENGVWTFQRKNGPFCTKIWSSTKTRQKEIKHSLIFPYRKTGDKSGAEAPGPSGFPISFNEFTNVFISAFIKWFRIFLFRSSWVTKG